MPRGKRPNNLLAKRNRMTVPKAPPPLAIRKRAAESEVIRGKILLSFWPQLILAGAVVQNRWLGFASMQLLRKESPLAAPIATSFRNERLRGYDSKLSQLENCAVSQEIRGLIFMCIDQL